VIQAKNNYYFFNLHGNLGNENQISYLPEKARNARI